MIKDTFESQCSRLSKFYNNRTHLENNDVLHFFFFFPVSAIYTVLRVLSGKITRATTEQLVASIEHQCKWNRDQHELRFTKLNFGYLLDGISSFRQLEVLPPSWSQLVIPAPTPLLCKLDRGSNYLSRCCFWAVNTFSTSSFLQCGRSRNIFRDTRAKGTIG